MVISVVTCVRTPAGTAGPFLRRQRRRCHLLAKARLASTWAGPGAEVPSDRACLQLHHSLDCKESISQENLRVSDCFSTVKNKTDSCCKRFSKCCILGINPSVRGKGTPFACFSGDQEGKLLVVWIPIPDSDTFKSFLTQTVRLKCYLFSKISDCENHLLLVTGNVVI